MKKTLSIVLITVMWINLINSSFAINTNSNIINEQVRVKQISNIIQKIKNEKLKKKLNLLNSKEKIILNKINNYLVNKSLKNTNLNYQLNQSIINYYISNWVWILEEIKKIKKLQENFNNQKSYLIKLLNEIYKINLQKIINVIKKNNYNYNKISNNNYIEKKIIINDLITLLINDLNKEQNYISNVKYKSLVDYLKWKTIDSLTYENRLLNYYYNWLNKDLKNKLIYTYKYSANKYFQQYYYNKIITKLWKINYTWTWNVYQKLNNYSTWEIINWLQWIKYLIVNRNWNTYKKILQNNYLNENLKSDINNNQISEMIKLSSLVWIRNLSNSVYHPKKDYHLWIDITIANRKWWMEFNCLKKNYKIYDDFIKKSDLNFNNCNASTNTKYKNYKLNYTMIVKVNLNYLKNNWFTCYIWKNRSLRKWNRLVWFWNFLICQWKNNIYSIYWHLNKKNKIFNDYNFNKQLTLTDIEWFKLNQILWSFYEPNYLNFNKKEYKFDWYSIQWLPYFYQIIWKNIFRKINLNKTKYLYLIMWNTWWSEWEHVHMWVVKISDDYTFVWAIRNNKKLISWINSMFWIYNQNWIKQISLKHNHYWFLWIK